MIEFPDLIDTKICKVRSKTPTSVNFQIVASYGGVPSAALKSGKIAKRIQPRGSLNILSRVSHLLYRIFFLT